jgi:branched-chain amino acid transport system substrate-binding protein
MPDQGPDKTSARVSRFASRSAIVLLGAWLASAASAAPGDNASVVRELASRVGPIVGSALACPEIGQPRIQVIADKFRAVIREVSSNEAERDTLSRLFDRYITDGRGSVTAGRMDCRTADRQLAELEQSLAGPSLSGLIGPSAAIAAPAPNPAPPQPPAAVAPAAVAPPPVATPPAPAAPSVMAAVTPTVTPAAPLTAANVRGVTSNEIRFGIVGPFSGSARELGRQMKLGIDTAFNSINDAGGVEGRMLRLVAADDGYEPSRTLDAMKQL